MFAVFEDFGSKEVETGLTIECVRTRRKRQGNRDELVFFLWLGAAFCDVDLRVHNKINDTGVKNHEWDLKK